VINIDLRRRSAIRLGELNTPLVERLMDEAFIEPFLKWTAKRLDDNRIDAEDVVGAARLRAIQREARGDLWDPDGGVSAGLYFLKVIRGVLGDRLKMAERRPEVGLERPDWVRCNGPSPEEEVTERLEANDRRRLANELHGSLVSSGKDPIAVGILEAVAAGLTGHPEMAVRMGCTVEEVRAGLKRLARYAQASVEAFRQQARFQ
jgi:hypothetical protein